VLETYALVIRLGDGKDHAFKVARRFRCDVEHESGDAALFLVGAGQCGWAFGGGLRGTGCAAEFDVDVWAELVRSL
jgi:hypothetical protein